LVGLAARRETRFVRFALYAQTAATSQLTKRGHGPELLPDELAFRNEVRDWLAANLPADIRDKVVNYRHLSKDDYVRWHKILAAKGWSVPHWPVEWGGTGWDITQRYIYDEEFGSPARPGCRRSARPCAPRCCCASARRAESALPAAHPRRATTSGCRAIPSPVPAPTWPR
jgi:hypothetical protein